jgi:hypothetical protein
MHKPASVVPPASFEEELEVFIVAVEEVTQIFYTYLTIHRWLERHVDLVSLANTHLMFFRTTLGSLRASTYIFIYKVFETRADTFNLRRLMRALWYGMDEFGPEAFCARKVKGNFYNTPLWLKDRVNDMYVLTVPDVEKLEKVEEPWRNLFVTKFKDQRNKWYGHREFANEIDAGSKLPETTVEDVEKLLAYLNNLSRCLSQLYYNGTELDFELLRDPVIPTEPPSFQVRVKQATDDFFAKLLGHGFEK